MDTSSSEEEEESPRPAASSLLALGQKQIFSYKMDPDDAQHRCQSAFLLDQMNRDPWRSSSGPLHDLCYLRVLSPSDPDRATVLRKLRGQEPWASKAEERAVGSLLGMALGDAMGARMEFKPVRYNTRTVHDLGKAMGGSFCLKPGQYTDDSSMGLCLADSLLNTKGVLDPHDLMLRFLGWWYGGYNNGFQYDDENKSKGSVGLGGNISMSMHNYLKYHIPYTLAGDKETSGNGSIMRNAASAICHIDDIEAAMATARMQSLVTHQGEEAAECCRLMAHIIVKAVNGEDKVSILSNLGTTFTSPRESASALARSDQEGTDPDRNWKWRAEDYRYSPTRSRQQPGYIGSYAMDGMCMGLHCVWSTSTFSQALLKSANICGDADSVTSVTGQMAGAIYGASEIPLEWIETLMQWDGGGDIALRAYRLFHHKWLE